MTDCLRLSDNPLLQHAETSVLVWIDQPHFAVGPRMSTRRRAFLLQAVNDVRERCRALGGDLVIRSGSRVDVLNQLAEQLKMPVLAARQTGWDERTENRELRHLAQMDARTLYCLEDLPFELDQVPEPFTAFRNKVQKKVSVPEPIATPTKLAPLPPVSSPVNCPLSPKSSWIRVGSCHSKAERPRHRPTSRPTLATLI